MKKQILLIEDEEDIRFFYKTVLGVLKVNIFEAVNGKQALKILEKNKNIDLIIMDIIMPEMDGEVFLKEIRINKQIDIPIIPTSVDKENIEKLKEIEQFKYTFYKFDSGSNLLKKVKDILKI